MEEGDVAPETAAAPEAAGDSGMEILSALRVRLFLIYFAWRFVRRTHVRHF